MTTEAQIAALMGEANPVPDLEAYDVDEVEVAMYLANLEQRSNEVTQLDTNKTEESVKTRSRRTWIAAAAAFVAGFSLAVVLSGPFGGDTASPTGDTASTTGDTASTTGDTASTTDEAGQIAFALTIPDEQAPLFAANGPAVDAGLICGTAVGRWRPQEDPEGNVLNDQQLNALWNRGEPYVTADVIDMICDDGSGSFTLRIFGETRPSDPDFSVETMETTWTITGGGGNGGLVGEGVGGGEQTRNAITVRSGSGSVTVNE